LKVGLTSLVLSVMSNWLSSIRGSQSSFYHHTSKALTLARVEAMAFGLLIITTETEDSEVVRGVSIIKPGDVDGLVRALNGLMGDGSLRRKLGEETLARARSLMWKDTCRQIMKLALDASDKLKGRR